MTKDALIEAIRTFDYFPTPAKLVEFFDDERFTCSWSSVDGKAVPVREWPHRGPAGGTENAWWQTNPRWPGDNV